MKLLLCTDHVFNFHDGRVYDDFCFDYTFFSDYLKVFSSVEVVCRGRHAVARNIEWLESDGPRIKFTPIPYTSGSSFVVDLYFSYRKLLRQSVNSCDVAIFRVPSFIGGFAAGLCRKLGKPYMVEVIGDPYSAFSSAGSGYYFKFAAIIGKFVMIKTCRNARLATYVASDGLSDLYPASRGSRVEFISSIRLAESDYIDPTDITGGPILSMVHLGTLSPRKRCSDILHCIAAMNREGRPIRLSFIGSGSEEIFLSDLAVQLGVQECVSFIGHVTGRKKIFDIVDNSQIVISASSSEGLPRSLIECMARGLIPIGARIPGVVSLVSRDLQFEVGDIDGMKSVISKMLVFSEAEVVRRRELSIKNARSYSESVLSPLRTSMYEQLKSLAITDDSSVI